MNLPADAFPVGVYAAERHMTPDAIKVEASEAALILWVAGLMVGVPRDADDTRLQATLHLAWHLSQSAERFGAMVRAELEERARARTAESMAAAMRAASHDHPDPACPAAAEEPIHPVSASPAGERATAGDQ
ncbi:hypothetical protein [Nonomuraea sp. GTA35]|uniref:hypothetical protein n=1 Tax=Nonomuraea sp. GTA35 TaxID=1676746 RepID=UPI0035C05C07